MFQFIVYMVILILLEIRAAPSLPPTTETLEIPIGTTAKLQCHSNDENHNFLFWKLAKDGAVIGPGNKFDDYKYNYEVLSGSLIIRAVSPEEDGIYTCFSVGVRTDNINLRSVRMVVTRDWEDVYENDPNVNYFRVVVVLSSVSVAAGFLYFAYTLRKKHRIATLLENIDDEDEDSGDEIFTAPGTSRGSRNIVLDKATVHESPRISTDFVDILNNSQNK